MVIVDFPDQVLVVILDSVEDLVTQDIAVFLDIQVIQEVEFQVIVDSQEAGFQVIRASLVSQAIVDSQVYLGIAAIQVLVLVDIQVSLGLVYLVIQDIAVFLDIADIVDCLAIVVILEVEFPVIVALVVPDYLVIPVIVVHQDIQVFLDCRVTPASVGVV